MKNLQQKFLSTRLLFPSRRPATSARRSARSSTARNARRRRRVPAIFFVIPVTSRSTATSKDEITSGRKSRTSPREKRCTRSWAASSTCWRARSSWPSAASSSSASSIPRPRRTSTSGPRSRFLTGVLCIFFASRRWRMLRSGPSGARAGASEAATRGAARGLWRRTRGRAYLGAGRGAHFRAYGHLARASPR